MLFDLSNYKVTVGSINVSPREDPINGPNGTAVTTRFNNFVEGVQGLFNMALPNNKGGLVTASQDGRLLELARGPSFYSLVSSPTSETGLAWEPRVDLTTDQSIGGKKTFTSLATLNGFISHEESQVLSDLLVDGILSADSGIFNQSLTAVGPGTFQSTLSVNGNATFKGRLDVAQLSTFGSSVVIAQGLTVGGGAALGSTLTVGGATSLESTLSVMGLSNMSSLELSGYLRVLGDVTGKDINSTGSLVVGSTANITSDLNVGGNLYVKGASNFATLGVNKLTATGDILSQSNISATGNLSGNALYTNSGNVQGNLDVAGQLSVNDLLVEDSFTIQGLMDIPSGLNVGQRLMLSGDLLVDGVSSFSSSISSTSASFSSSVSVGGPITVDSLISRTTSVLEGPVDIGSRLVINGPLTTKSTANISGSLTVGGGISTTGTITANTLSSNTITTKVLSTDTFKASQGAEVMGDLIVSGGIVSSSMSTGMLEVSSIATVEDLHVNGELVLNNPLTIPGLSGVNTGDEKAATPTRMGVVLVDELTVGDPRVYTTSTVDELFVRKDDTNLIRVDDTGYIPEKYIPPKAFTRPVTVTSEGAMLSLIAQEGDIAIRADIERAFILSSGPSNQLSSWVPLNFELPANLVQSIHGRVGIVVSQEGDYTSQQITYTNSALPSIKNVHTMLGELYNKQAQHESDTSNPHQLTIEQLEGIPMNMIGVPQGVAPLDSKGYVTNLKPTRLEYSFTQADIVNGLINIPHTLAEAPLVQVISSSMMVQKEVDITTGVNQVTLDLSAVVPIPGTWKAVLKV